jgi:hypothetical protein
MFEHLDSIPWGQLSHAYGPATDAPHWIRALASDDADERTEAVYHFLLSSAFHQFTLYSATPHVIPFVIEALRDPAVSERPVGEDGDPLMKEDLLCFLRACAEASRLTDDVGRAIAAGRELYALYARDPGARTREYAEKVLAFCDGHPVIRRQANPPLQRTGAAGIFAGVRKWLGRGPGR